MVAADIFQAQLIAVCKVIAVATGVLMLMCSETHHFSGVAEEDDATFAEKVANRAYYTLALISTIGWGEMLPKSKTCKAVTAGLLLAITVHIISLIAPA
jgi:hypothetical protein